MYKALSVNLSTVGLVMGAEYARTNNLSISVMIRERSSLDFLRMGFVLVIVVVWIRMTPMESYLNAYGVALGGLALLEEECHWW